MVEYPASFVEAGLLAMFAAGADPVAAKTVAAGEETGCSKKHPKMTPATDFEASYVGPGPFVEIQGESRRIGPYLNSAGTVHYSTQR